MAPANAVINMIAISGDSFSANIISKDIHEINVIPDDNPSNPSIKFIAFVIPTIQPTVSTKLKTSFNITLFSLNGIVKLSIKTPLLTTTIAAITCPASFTSGFMSFTSSI